MEIVVVLAILAIIAAIAIPVVSSIINQSEECIDKSNIQKINIALKTAYVQIENHQFNYDPSQTLDKITVETALKAYGLNPDEVLISKTTKAQFNYNTDGIVTTGGGNELKKEILIKDLLFISNE